MSDSSIISTMCLHTSYEIYKIFVYHSWSALVLILHYKQVHLPPQNAWILAQKRKQGGTFGYKKRWVILQLCLPSVCTHHMRYIKDVCIIHEWSWYWYSKNKSVYHHRTNAWIIAQISLKPKQGSMFGLKKRWAILQLYLLSVCTRHMWFINDVCIIKEWPWYWYSTKKSVQHPRMSKLLLKHQNREVHLAGKGDKRFFNYVYHIFAHIIWDV